MVKIIIFQTLLFIITAITINSMSTVKQHLGQHVEMATDKKLSINSVGNPYVLACNSSSQCQGTVLAECIMDIPEPDTWYCNCWCDGYGPCENDRDCCNNNCVGGFCSKNGGEQGTVCLSPCSSCAKGFDCQLWPYDGVPGYCNYNGDKSTYSIPETTTNIYSSSSSTPGQKLTSASGNPWIYVGCPNGNIDCQDTVYHTCVEIDPNNPNTWVCRMVCEGFNCQVNQDCPNNECVNGICSSSGGLEGTYCDMNSNVCSSCNQNLTCYSVGGGSGYCGYT